MLPAQKQRFFNTQQEAIAEGYKYIPEDAALLRNIQNAYTRVADKQFSEWMIANHPHIRRIVEGGRRKAEEKSLKEFGPEFVRTVFTGPDAADLHQLMKDELMPIVGDLDKMLTAGAKVNAVGRFMTLNGDASQFLIQLMWLTGTPRGMKAWGLGVWAFGNTLFNPRYHARLIDNNRSLLIRYRGLITSLNGTEFGEAVEKGGLLTMGPQYAPWRLAGKALDPFARAYAAAMDTAGIELAKSMDMLRGAKFAKYKTPEGLADVAAYLNEIRGLASSARLGQSARWRSVESNLLLASRYNRSIAALLWDTFANKGIRGDEARKALASSLTGITALAAAISIGQYLKDTPREDWNIKDGVSAVWDHISPASPTFFGWKVGNSVIGPGTKIRSLIKLFAQSVKDPRSLLEISMENPALRFGRGNLAPVLSDVTDVLSGYNYMGDPTGFRDGWDDSVWQNLKQFGGTVLAPDLVPIWIQAALLEGGTVEERALRGGVEFWGARGYAASERALAESLAKEQGLGKLEDLPRRQQREFYRQVEEEFGTRGYTRKEGPWREKIDEADDQFIDALQKAADTLLSARPETTEFKLSEAESIWRKAQTVHRNQLYGSWNKKKGRAADGYYDHIYDMDAVREEPSNQDSIEHVLWRYYQLVPNATDAEGVINWDDDDKAIPSYESLARSFGLR